MFRGGTGYECQDVEHLGRDAHGKDEDGRWAWRAICLWAMRLVVVGIVGSGLRRTGPFFRANRGRRREALRDWTPAGRAGSRASSDTTIEQRCVCLMNAAVELHEASMRPT